MQEAKDSSEIENIITTHDDLYKAHLFSDYLTPASKEVQSYATALKCGFERIRKTEVMRLSDILEVQKTLVSNHAGLRKLPGTAFKNQQTGEVIYTPPQDHHVVEQS